jgi:hypothetical protein
MLLTTICEDGFSATISRIPLSPSKKTKQIVADTKRYEETRQAILTNASSLPLKAGTNYGLVITSSGAGIEELVWVDDLDELMAEANLLNALGAETHWNHSVVKITLTEES